MVDFLSFIKLWAEPPVQHLSFPARAAVHSGIWTLWLLALELAVWGVVSVLRKTHLGAHGPTPKLSALRLLAESAVGSNAWTWLLGAFIAWLNPGAPGGLQWDYSCPNLLALGYFCLAVILPFDAYSYFIHSWMHRNKTAFRLLHRKHHDMRASLNVLTTGYMSAAEGQLSAGIPMLCLYVAGVATGNWWYSLAALWNAFYILQIGHSGAELTMHDARDLAAALLNPMALFYFMVPCHSSPMDHADHHTTPTKHFSFFFTWWDDRYGSSTSNQPPCSLLVLAMHAIYQAALFGSIYAFLTSHSMALAVYVGCYWLVQPSAAASIANWGRLPQATRALFGWLMDAYRRDNHITYDVHAALRLGAASGEAPSDGDKDTDAALHDRDQDSQRLPEAQQAQEPVYIFACHPTGMISRAAFCTFAARGAGSPVSALREVRLAVGSQLFRVPIAFLREFLLACGCIPAERSTMQTALAQGCSVAVTPGGWREGRFHGSYRLVLKARKGFVQLSQETGAALVPVLCVGEQDVARAHSVSGPLLWAYRFLTTFRPSPVKVAFGQPVCPQQGEGVDKLHSRYIQALLALGKQHGVQLEFVL